MAIFRENYLVKDNLGGLNSWFIMFCFQGNKKQVNP